MVPGRAELPIHRWSLCDLCCHGTTVKGKASTNCCWCATCGLLDFDVPVGRTELSDSSLDYCYSHVCIRRRCADNYITRCCVRSCGGHVFVRASVGCVHVLRFVRISIGGALQYCRYHHWFPCCHGRAARGVYSD